MGTVFPTGSEWRKWDLHVHLPGTNMNDGYGHEDNVLDKFCEEIEKSDVEVIGITDYFSVDKYFDFVDKFYEKYPESTKVFFPNIELRLNESVNSGQEEVNMHLLLPPDIEKTKAIKLLDKLKTELTDGHDRNKTCAELTAGDCASATVTRENIKLAIKDTFGEKIIRQDHLLVITAANNDGLRPRRGANRKLNITDQIDKFSDAYFGGSQNTEYFQNENRLEDEEQTVKAKPVYSGSDSHSFDDLTNWLGKAVDCEGVHKEVTWIKANPTLEGLQQTLIEPDERVRIQPLMPDEKEPYKYISKVKFSGTNDFPIEIEFNSNLSSIIGSRSSGKSALLAYIAYSIDPEDTINRQMAAQEMTDRNKVGPAAGKTWSSVAQIKCEVEWGVGKSENGRVIYIPQNYLYSISKRPSEITKKIEPVLFTNYPAIKNQFDKTAADVSASNEIIRESTADWFNHDGSISQLKQEILNLGDKKAIETTKSGYKAQIDELKKHLSLTQADIDSYQQVIEQVSQKQNRLNVIAAEIESITPFYNETDPPTIENINPSISFYPNLNTLPSKLQDEINASVTEVNEKLATDIKSKVSVYRTTLTTEQSKVKQEITDIQASNKELIEKNQQNVQLAKLIDNFNKQASVLTDIESKEVRIKELEDKKTELVEKINGAVLSRTQSQFALSQIFSSTTQNMTDMTFGVEIELNPTMIVELSDKYDKRESSPNLDNGTIKLDKVRSELATYLNYMNTSQKLKLSQSKQQVAIATLCTTEEIRFNATLESDKIGGFQLSTMTPGKQALFALTLILDESDDAWPLFIDQPEDDLDSRSIYDYIVPYLKTRKKERQILMVSHNANLVVGADSEQVVVANRHGADRKNRDNKTFDYLTGAIEDSKPKSNNQYVLESCGIREHSIDILDGGKEAFEKRRDKYKI